MKHFSDENTNKEVCWEISSMLYFKFQCTVNKFKSIFFVIAYNYLVYYNNKKEKIMILITDDEIFERIKKVITTHEGISEDSITLDTSFYEDLDADSLDIIELTLRFEEAFKIDMAEEDSLKLRTVRDMCAYVKSKIDAKKT